MILIPIPSHPINLDDPRLLAVKERAIYFGETEGDANDWREKERGGERRREKERGGERRREEGLPTLLPLFNDRVRPSVCRTISGSEFS